MLPQAFPRPVEPGFNSALGAVQDIGDFAIAEPFIVMKQDGHPLLVGEGLNCLGYLGGGVPGLADLSRIVGIVEGGGKGVFPFVAVIAQ